MNRIRFFASTTVTAVLVAAMAQGCSSDDSDGGTSSGGSSASGGSGGTGGGTGGSGATGGSGGSTGGTGGSTGGTGGSAGGTGGSAGDDGGSTGGSAGADGGGQCGTGISNGAACTASCTGNVCGLADLGRRDCACVNDVWDCESCEFPGNESILEAPDGALPACPAGDASDSEDALKGETCTTQGERCEPPEDTTRVCACWTMPTDLEWDCDKKPWL